MRYTILILLLSLEVNAYELVQKQIEKNKPNIKNSVSLSKTIDKKCKKYKIPCEIYTAILMQESSYILNAISPDKKDLGIAQINEKTAISYQFDTLKLITDLDYSLDAGAAVLSWFYENYSQKEPEMWFTRYNCGTRKSVNRKSCNKYKNLVARWIR